MSLLNGWIHATEALLCVDTDGARVDGSRFSSSKLLPIPHLGCALAVRGQAALLQGLFLRAAGAGFSTFDELNDVMPAVLEDLIETMPPRLLVTVPHVKSGNVVVLAGWSDARGAMIGRQFVQREAGETFAADDFTTVLTPWPPALHDLPKGSADEDRVRIARAQVQWMRDTYPGAIVGGKLLACRITREGIVVGHRLSFDVEAMTA